MKRTARRQMWKRALGILLVCAMFFSGADLTALATEPGVGMEMTTQEEETETAAPDESDGIPDKAEGTDESNRPDDSGQGTGEVQGPEVGDTAEEGDTDGDDQDGNEEQSDVTTGEEESVSENSVSENSVSENSVFENSLVTVNAANSFGRFFAEALSESVSGKAENAGCDIYEITLNGTEASVSFRTVESGTLVVGVYDEESDRLVAAGSVEVNPGDTGVMVPIETDDMPEYFVLRGFLVETESARPLGRMYETENYTRKMQEFYAKTTADFAGDQVLNLDSDTYNNFLVFSETVKVIRKSENVDVNKVVECDEENRCYRIENPDDNFTSVSAGDIIAYYYDDNALIITKVHSITSDVEGDKTFVSVLGEDVDFDTVIEFIKVGAENPNVDEQSAYATYAQSSEEYSKEWSIEDKSLEEDGMSLNLKDIGGESSIRLFRDWKNDIEATELEISYGATASVECKVSGEKRWELGNPTMPTNIPGVTLNCKIEVKLAGEVTGSYTGSLSGTIGVAIDEDGVRNISRSPEFTVSESVEAAVSLGLVISPMIKFLHEKLLSAALEVDGGVKVTAKIEAAILDTAAERHACEACFTVGIGPYVNITGKLTLLLKTKEVEMLDKDWTALQGYYSVDYGQFGWGECPFKKYRTTVVVKTLSSQLVKGARVNNEATTNKRGTAQIWLPGGRQMIYATYNGKMGSKYINADGVKSVDVILGMYANLGNDAVMQVCLGAFDRSAAVTRDGSLYTWGSNSLGSLGTGGDDDKSIPTKVLNNVKTVYSSASHTRINAAITKNGDLYTWGQNAHGALGNGSTENLYRPGKILSNVKSVGLGYYSGAAVTRDGQLYIWGKNPVRILEDENIADVCLGVDSTFGYSAALTKDGQLYMWGCNVNGELGNGKQGSSSQSEPVRILEDEKIKKVCLSGGRGYSAAVTEGGQLYMWGYNGFGQLGNGTTATQTEPVKILEGVKVKEVAVGNTGDCYYSAAVTEDGQLYMWGRNTYGQLGKGDTDDRTVPVKIDGLGKVKHVCISSYHTAAITEDGQLYMWGRNNRGQLGDGSTEDKYTPVKVLDNVMSVDVQDAYTAAVTEDGSLWMWGYNNNGQLGNGEEAFRAVTEPVKVMFPTDIEKSVQNISEGYLTEGEEVLASVADAYVFDEETLESKEAAYVYETLRTSSYPENSPVLVTDAENPLRQTADFSGLKSQETYNVYVMKDKDSKQRLSQDNLLYITQAVSGADGNLSITYEMREVCEQPDVFCVGMTRTDLSAAEINVPDITYDGEEQVVETEVTINGRTLIAGTDYEIYGNCVVSEIGEYKIVIKGIGTYCGEKEAVFRVVEGTIPDDPDDPTPDPVYGDVLPEDIPTDGIIPEGLWIAGVSEAGYDYTGKAIKPEARVYDHKTRLMEKTDYTIAYKNNIKAYSYSASNQEFAANKAPTITVTGKGNYIGKETQTFRILPLDISAGSDASDGTDTEAAAQSRSNVFTVDNMTIAANKKNQKPVPALMWNDKKLKNNTDYTVTYYDSTGAKRLDYVKDAGNYYIELTAKGNFTGARRVNLTVIDQSDQLKLISKMTVAKISNQPYTGSAIEPTLTVKDGKTTLNKNEHYTVSYSSNTEIGTAYAIVTGIEAKGYSGTKRVSFKITGGSVSKAAVTGLTGQTFIYGGVNKEPELTVAVKVAGVEKTLKKGADYKVTWQKNRDAGTATAIITGVGGYTGTLKKTFKIRAFDIAANAGGRFTAVLMQDEVSYAKGGTKPEVAVTFLRDNGTAQKLQEGKDYTLSYKNHTMLNDGSREDKLPTVIMKGKGNFKGTYSTKLTYKITTQGLGNLTLTAADKTYQNKKNIFATKVTIIDLNGKVLKAGTDYDKAFTYAYKNQTTLDNGTVRAAGTAVDKSDIIPAGTVLEVTVSAKGNYTGTKTGEYRIAQASISSASVSIPKQTYTGRAITPDKDQITVKIKGKPVDASQYEIVPGSYKNNVKKGTASVTIRGVDNYGGTKTVKFTIRAKGFLWWWRKG